jgi:signal transduction histidine kinase
MRLPLKMPGKGWLLIFAYFNVHAIFLFSYKYLDFLTRDHHISPVMPFFEEFTGTYGAFVLLPFVIWVARKNPFHKNSWLKPLLVHLVAMTVFSIAHTTWNWVTRLLLAPLIGLGHYDYGRIVVRYPMEYSGDVIAWISLVGFVYLFDYYRASKQRELQTAQLEASLAQSQLQNLRLQMEPHFLFNSLNAISATMYEDVRAADEMISALSDLLRNSLSNSRAQEVPLHKEVELLEDYLSVMRARLEDRLVVDLDVQPGTEEALVPSLVLQPLVENSIRHGLDPKTAALRIEVSAKRDGGALHLQVRDNGRGLPKGETAVVHKGIGLGNTESRLEALYGSEHRLQWQAAPEGGFLVTLEIPYHTHEPDPSPAYR